MAAILLATTIGTAAESQEPTPTPAAAGPVVVGEIQDVQLLPGTSHEIRVPIRVATGHRVQANPASSEFLVPLEILLDGQDGLDFGSPVYPIADLYLLEGSDEPLLTYVGEFEVVLPVTVGADADSGPREVSGELLYQACNSRMCLFPSSLPVRFEVVVAAAAEKPKNES